LIWRVPLSIALWLLRVALFIVLALIGVPLIVLMTLFDWYEPRYSRRFGRIVLQWRAQWLVWPYCNFEDGIDGLRGGDPAQKWWADRTGSWTVSKRILVWSAFRNPVDALRWVPLLNPVIGAEKIRFVGMDHEPAKGEGGWYFAWLDGTAYSCIRYETKHYRFWLGNKLKPEDRNGLPDWDPRRIRCDFAIQLKKIT